jgi:hypothetical protein
MEGVDRMTYESESKWYLIPMPLDKNGDGPADPKETVRTVYEIWNDNFETACICSNFKAAKYMLHLKSLQEYEDGLISVDEIVKVTE